MKTPNMSFDQLYDATLEIRRYTIDLNELLDQVIKVLEHDKEVTAWWRNRKRYSNLLQDKLDETLNEFKGYNKKQLEKEREYENKLDRIKYFKRIIPDYAYENNLRNLVDKAIYELDLKDMPYRYEHIFVEEWLIENHNAIARDLKNISVKNDYELEKLTAKKNAFTNALYLLEPAKTIKDIVSIRDEFNSFLTKLRKQEYITNIPLIPYGTDNAQREQLFEEVHAVMKKLRSVPAPTFADVVDAILTKISHDMSNNRGMRAFSNRQQELIAAANQFITKLNGWWQISGRRWERIGSRNRHGWKTVKPKKPEIPTI